MEDKEEGVGEMMILLMMVNLIEDWGSRLGLGVEGDCVMAWEDHEEEQEEGRVIYVWRGRKVQLGDLSTL
jgi:hypothetical protein